MLGGKEEQPFDGFNFLFGEFSASFFLKALTLALTLREFINRFCLEEFVTIPVYENKFRALSNHVPNGK